MFLYRNGIHIGLSGWFSVTFANERYLLGEYLQETALSEMDVQALQGHWLFHVPLSLISSFFLTYLHTMRRKGGNYLLGAIFDMWLGNNWGSLLEIHYCISIHLLYKQLVLQRIKAIQKTLPIIYWFIQNDMQLANRLFFLMVLIFSDNPYY